MTNEEVGKRLGNLMHYCIEWWTEWHQDTANSGASKTNIQETDGGIKFEVRDDGIAIFPNRERKRGAGTEPAPQTVSPDPAETEFLEFTQKEISKMPTFFRKEFRLKGGKIAYIRVKPNGSYEVRYRRGGLEISVSAKTVEAAKERFIQRLCEVKTDGINGQTFFGQYATQWLEVVKKPQVKENTLEDYRFTLRKYVFPRFGKMRLRDIKPFDVQRLLNDLEKKGIRRGAEGVYVLLRAIFEFAVADNLITKSPMALIRKPKHETKHGKAFAISEEQILIDRCLESTSYCRYAFILMLFTGIRRSELPTVEVTPQWVTVISAKTRKGESERKRKIPVSPMLKPFLPFVSKSFANVRPETLTSVFSKIMPGRHLHELRHTFITRCQECGISRELTSVWAGHKADNTMTSNVYTHFSDEFQLDEIKKLRY